jgi:hypothetical protein
MHRLQLLLRMKQEQVGDMPVTGPSTLYSATSRCINTSRCTKLGLEGSMLRKEGSYAANHPIPAAAASSTAATCNPTHRISDCSVLNR